MKISGQCPVKAHAYPSSIFCGDSISLSALGKTRQPIIINFNKGKIDSLARSTPNGVVQDSSCFGASAEGKYYLMMTTSTDTPRYVKTLPVDLYSGGVTGGTICFLMKYGEQKGFGSDGDKCEGLDWSSEGVYLEYRVPNSDWTIMKYWDPNPIGLTLTNGMLSGGHDSTLINWNRYCLRLPDSTLTISTEFRWIQKDCNGPGYDAWAIDDIIVTLDIEGYKYDWTHDGILPSITSDTPLVTPISDTTYTVYYSNGTNTCSDSVKVNVLPPRDINKASAECLCSHLYIPNAFTPNGDLLNDEFSPITFNVIDYELEIFNRYGASIYKTVDYKRGWNGKINNTGDVLQQDVYVYTIMIRNFDRKIHYYIGKIVIIK